MKQPFGNFLREQRERARLTQQELADQLTSAGFPYAYQTIAGWEAGRAMPSLNEISGKTGASFINSLARILNVSSLRILEAGGFLERVQLKFEADVYELAAMLEVATPTQREIIKNILQEFVSGN